MTKLYSIPLVFLFTSLLFSCKDDETASFNLAKTAEVVLPGASVSGIRINLNSETFIPELNELLEENKTNQSSIESIVLDQVTLSILEPEESTLTFMDEVIIYIKDGNNDTIQISKIHTLSSAEKSTRVMNVPVLQREDYQSWISKESLQYILVTKINDFYPESRSFGVRATFKIQANVVK